MMTTLRNRIVVPVALVGAVVGVTLAVVAWQASSQGRALARDVAEIRAANAVASELADAVAEEQPWVLSFPFRTDTAHEARVAAGEARGRALMAQVDVPRLPWRAAELWREYVAARALLLGARDDLVAAAQAGDDERTALAFERWHLASDRAHAVLASFATFHVRRVERAVVDLQHGRDRALRIAGAAMLLGVALAVGLAMLLARALVRPLAAMAAAAERVAEHDLAVRIPGASRSDEIGALARAFDRMTERLVSANRGLEDAVRARDEFISIASHELKTPLTPLKLHLQALLRLARGQDPIPPDRLLRSTDGFERLVSRMAKLVENMLDVSRIASGRLVLDCAPVSVPELLEETVERLRPQAVAAGCRLTLVAAYRGVVTVDRVRLDQVIENLVTNATKYAPGTDVTVRSEARGAELVIDVSDGGPGVPAGHEERIFERFERAVADAHGVAGLGLGLHIAREIVRAHGGEVTVASAPGQGATFRIELPLRADDRPRRLPGTRGPGQPDPRRLAPTA